MQADERQQDGRQHHDVNGEEAAQCNVGHIFAAAQKSEQERAE
ncbi:MAG: hypothetical protein ALAOOOJD_01572 [bacterium]|nr:hypothetical protein [bacterium]